MNSQRPTEPVTLSLDARIRGAEERLVARESALKWQLSQLRLRAERALRPQRLIAPVAGAVFAAVAAWWALRGGGRGGAALRGSAAAGGMRAAAARSFIGRLPWAQMIPFAWPLLPTRWRNRMSPATATTLLALGLPVVDKLLAPRSAPRRGAGRTPLATAAPVSLRRYAGTWHEIARLPAPFEALCAGQPSAIYTLRADGGVDVVNRCRLKTGNCHDSTGVARVVAGSGGAKLKVSLFPRLLRWLPFAWADYWIIHLDDAYSVAIVGNPGRNFMWMLARSRQLPASTLRELVDIAREQGFDVERLRYVRPR